MDVVFTAGTYHYSPVHMWNPLVITGPQRPQPDPEMEMGFSKSFRDRLSSKMGISIDGVPQMLFSFKWRIPKCMRTGGSPISGMPHMFWFGGTNLSHVFGHGTADVSPSQGPFHGCFNTKSWLSMTWMQGVFSYDFGKINHILISQNFSRLTIIIFPLYFSIVSPQFTFLFGPGAPRSCYFWISPSGLFGEQWGIMVPPASSGCFKIGGTIMEHPIVRNGWWYPG